MAVDIEQTIHVYESGDTKQFTLSMTPSRPSTVAFNITDFFGGLVAIESVQSGASVAESGTTTSLFYINRVLPTTPSLYFGKWTAWDSASRPYVVVNEFEVRASQAYSFATYADVLDVIKNARQLFARSDMTVQDIAAHIKAADAWINTKLSLVVASVPVSPTPDFLQGMAKSGALYFYYSERYGGENDKAPPAIVDMWDRYNELLDAVVAGSAGLPGVTIVTAEGQDIWVSFDGNIPISGHRDFEEQQRDVNIILEERSRYD